MRGEPERQMAMLTTLTTEDLIPADHPIRRIRKVVDEVLASLDAEMDCRWEPMVGPLLQAGLGPPWIDPLTPEVRSFDRGENVSASALRSNVLQRSTPSGSR